MIPRVPEPEVMDSRQEALDYDSMDHGQVNRVFVNDYLRAWGPAVPHASGAWSCVDAGTGTARIPIELCRRAAGAWTVLATDLSREMLFVGSRNVAAARLSDSVVLTHADCKRLPVRNGSVDAVMSNSIVHHIPVPRIVLREMLRVLSSGGLLFVRDLMRPADIAEVDHLVVTYAGDENDHQRKMFRDSLRAALSLHEIRRLLVEVDLPSSWASATSDRHWTVSGRVP